MAKTITYRTTANIQLDEFEINHVQRCGGHLEYDYAYDDLTTIKHDNFHMLLTLLTTLNLMAINHIRVMDKNYDELHHDYPWTYDNIETIENN